tara:strand:- start:3 stop:263 length:261 start_codon:yes stop_codon:yes gene_type:complete
LLQVNKWLLYLVSLDPVPGPVVVDHVVVDHKDRLVLLSVPLPEQPVVLLRLKPDGQHNCLLITLNNEGLKAMLISRRKRRGWAVSS